MNVQIQNITDMEIKGVSYRTPKDCDPYKETYFTWTPYPLKAEFEADKVICGLLTAWHNQPEFRQVEIHCDREAFYFIDGTCIMIFCDLKEDKPVMESVQIARIEAGTQILIEPGKAHFVPVAETDCFRALVYSPAMEAPRIELAEPVLGI